MLQEILDDAKAIGKTLDPESVAFTLGYTAGFNEETTNTTNTALIFVKPHANNKKVQDLVRKGLTESKFEITMEKDVSAEEILKGSLAAKHYYAIASKAGYVPSFNSPKDLNIPKDRFEKQFGENYDEAFAAGKVFSGKACAEFLKISNAELDDINFKAKKAGDFIKFGGGFYCGRIDGPAGKIYVINAFCGNMLDAYVAAGSQGVHIFVVSWDEKDLSWGDFRGKVLGPTDPADAPKDSLRGQVLSNWEALGLTSKPNGGLNGVHGSASPFEAMSEIENWCGVALGEQQFYKTLKAKGVSPKQVDAWKFDAQIIVRTTAKGSSFDAVEDMDCSACADELAAMAKLN